MRIIFESLFSNQKNQYFLALSDIQKTLKTLSEEFSTNLQNFMHIFENFLEFSGEEKTKKAFNFEIWTTIIVCVLCFRKNILKSFTLSRKNQHFTKSSIIPYLDYVKLRHLHITWQNMLEMYMIHKCILYIKMKKYILFTRFKQNFTISVNYLRQEMSFIKKCLTYITVYMILAHWECHTKGAGFPSKRPSTPVRNRVVSIPV